MRHSECLARRQALRLTGAATTTALAAGCLGSTGTGDGDEPTGDDDAADETETENADEDPTGDPADAGDDGTEGSGTPEDDDPSSQSPTEAWADVEEVVLSATTAGWKGVEPEPIAGEENPLLVLTAGREYVLSWHNEDGQPHNIEIWDENGELVGDYGTELMDEEGATQSLEIEASAEMAEYVCEIHAGWQKRGRIEVEQP